MQTQQRSPKSLTPYQEKVVNQAPFCILMKLKILLGDLHFIYLMSSQLPINSKSLLQDALLLCRHGSKYFTEGKELSFHT